jgi:hypothetical protein
LSIHSQYLNKKYAIEIPIKILNNKYQSIVIDLFCNTSKNAAAIRFPKIPNTKFVIFFPLFFRLVAYHQASRSYYNNPNQQVTLLHLAGVRPTRA